MIKRKTTGSMVCPGCGRLISANAQECIHCGRKNPGLWGYGPGIRKLLGGAPGTITLLSGACILLYIISILLDISALLQPRGIFGLLAPGDQALVRMGMTGRYMILQGKWWTLITAIYLHGGLLHILFNVLWLRQLGYMVQELFGSSRTFLLFTLTGAAGFIASVLLSPHFTIGASGSIFGLLGALVYYGRKRGGQFGAAIFRQVGSWALILFLFGFMMPAVNNLAHAGGFISGYLFAGLLGYQEKSRENSGHRFMAMVALGITIGSFLLAFFGK